MPPGPRVSRLLLLAIATGFGVSSTVQAYFLHRVSGDMAWREGMLMQLITLNLVYWYIPALLAPAIMSLAQRCQLGHVRWPVLVAVHAAGAITYSIVHTIAMLGMRSLWFTATGRTFSGPAWWAMIQREYLTQLDWQVMTYLFFVGLGHALTYRRESEARAIDAAHLETRLVEARLQALQRQLHPHFLFNTLNAISQLMRTDVNAADRMIDGLGDLLRMTLKSSGIQEVTVKEELEALQKYLEIEQTRFGARLKIATHIDASTLDALVPNLVLQPLVENAVRHGIAPHARPGAIAVEASRKGAQLVLHVHDSGDGPPPERLTALNHGVGLANTRARLEHLYPGQHELVFCRQSDGFSVRVTLPLRLREPREPAPAVREGAA